MSFRDGNERLIGQIGVVIFKYHRQDRSKMHSYRPCPRGIFLRAKQLGFKKRSLIDNISEVNSFIIQDSINYLLINANKFVLDIYFWHYTSCQYDQHKSDIDTEIIILKQVISNINNGF